MINVNWGNPQQSVLVYSFVTPWTWDEYYSLDNRVRDMLESAQQTVDVILDFSEGRQVPEGALAHLRRLLTSKYPNRGMVYIVGTNTVVETLGNVITTVYPAASQIVRRAKTMDAAYTQISRVRQPERAGHV